MDRTGAISGLALAAAVLAAVGPGRAQAPDARPPDTAPLHARAADLVFRAPLRATFPSERPSWGEMGFAFRGVRWRLAAPDPVPAPGARAVTVRQGYGPGSELSVEAMGDPGGVTAVAITPIGRVRSAWVHEVLSARGARLERLACRSGRHRSAVIWYLLTVPEARPALLAEERNCTDPRARGAPRCRYAWRVGYGARLTPPANATSTPEQCVDPNYPR